MSTIYKIHPAIGVARVGDSEDFYLGPEAAGALPFERDGNPVTQFRDNKNAVRRQAARFRVYAYDTPDGAGREIVPGQGGVKDIQWTVYLANKKAAWYEFQQQNGANGDYSGHALRNPRTTGAARQKLIIDPGPQTITCLGTGSTQTQAEFAKGKGPAHFTQNFPPTGLIPEGNDITTLGSIFTDSSGYLYTLGGYGRSGVDTPYDITSFLLATLNPNDADDDEAQLPKAVVDRLKTIADQPYGSQPEFEAAIKGALGSEYADYFDQVVYYAYPQPRLDDYANNSFWWDDVSDGPVTATLIMENGPPVEVQVPSWVIVTPPAFAPQILNMITLYDTIYDVFVREGNLNPGLYSNKQFNKNYKPNYQAEIQPILTRPNVYRWVANIQQQGVDGHSSFVNTQGKPTNFFDYVRAPEAVNDPSPGLMPKLAGDNPLTEQYPRKYLVLTDTQYFLLSQYSQGICDMSPPQTTGTPQQQLDRGVLDNCVGGPFCPGIEVTWISRDINFYSEPFRFKHKPLNGKPLTWDNNPHDGQGLEPGDASKYMALPWQADFNECSNQPIDGGTLWWWPAQRPYYVYYRDEQNGPVKQGYWTRPKQSNFIRDETMIFNWNRLGFILQQNGNPQFLEQQKLPFVRLDMDTPLDNPPPVGSQQ